MVLSYVNIVQSFLGKVTDLDFLNMDEEDFSNLTVEYLHSTFARPYIRTMFSSIEYDDDKLEVTYELKDAVDDSSSTYFVTEVLAKGMVIAWLEPQVKNHTMLKQFIGTSKEKFYAQSNQLAQMQNLLTSTQVELRKMIRDDGYLNNSYIAT